MKSNPLAAALDIISRIPVAKRTPVVDPAVADLRARVKALQEKVAQLMQENEALNERLGEIIVAEISR
jgi:hypothetical protein